jgi:Protein of unknown function (DUF4012)
MRNVNQVEVRNKQQAEAHGHNAKSLPRKSLLIGLLLIILCSFVLSGVGSLAYATDYRNDLPIAKAGVQHLEKAEALLATLRQNPLDTDHIALAQQEFTAALQNFDRVNGDLQFVPGIAALLPIYGNRIHAALHLVPLAIALSQAGISGCDLLELLTARLHNPLNAQIPGITMADITLITQSIHDIQTSLMAANNEVNQLQPSDLQFDPSIGKLMNSMHTYLPALQAWISAIYQVLPSVPAILGIGMPANYLIEVLDATELRPGGGFIGNYGIASFSNGLLTTTRITDTDLLDHPFADAGFGIPFPPQYRWFDIALGNWGLRDSNLDADFPTDARSAETLYTQEGGNIPVQGVIAITPTFIEHVLTITGPITIPEYHETVSAQNLVERIHYHQLGDEEGSDNIASPDGYSSLRKHFTALLAEHLFAHIHQLAASHAGEFLQLILNAVGPKDLQIYFNDAHIETLLHNAHLDAAIQTPPYDNLLIVDANIAANKANNFITSTLDDSVTIDADGNAVHHATLHYAWTTPGQNYGSPLYRDYVRVYAPPGSVLQTQDGWQTHRTSEAFGHEVWAGFFTLTYGQTNTITLTWQVPHAATRDAHGWHYQEMVQRQASVAWTVHTRITLPSCATLTGTSGGLKSVGKQTAMLNQSLTENILSTINYTC